MIRKENLILYMRDVIYEKIHHFTVKEEEIQSLIRNAMGKFVKKKR